MVASDEVAVVDGVVEAVVLAVEVAFVNDATD